MKIVKKLLLPSIFILLSCFSSYKLAYWVAETYFFDKFFYQKSIKHGYYGFHMNLRKLKKTDYLKDFKERIKDLTELKDKYDNLNACSVNNDSNDFSIVIIGDSYVYGAGVKQDEILSNLLINKFKSEFPKLNIKITTLEKSGNSIFDYYMYSNRAKYYYNPDVFVYVLVHNDAIIRYEDSDFKKFSFEEALLNKCQETQNLTFSVFTKILLDTKNVYLANKEEWKNIKYSWKNPANKCVLNYILDNLPDNSIYIAGDFYVSENKELWQMRLWQNFLPILKEHKISLLFPEETKNNKKYKRFWENPEKYMQVSKKEAHPSKIMHQIYSDLIFEEITTNPRWGFIEN